LTSCDAKERNMQLCSNWEAEDVKYFTWLYVTYGLRQPSNEAQHNNTALCRLLPPMTENKKKKW